MSPAHTNLMELADRAWQGLPVPELSHPFSHLGSLAEVAPRTAFLASFGNSSLFETDEGLLMVDTGATLFAEANHEVVRQWTSQPLHTAVYTHGHIDHVFGLAPYEREAETAGRKPPSVVAHENVPPRFDRYRRTAGYNEAINQRQFRAPGLRWPLTYRYPDQTFRDTLDMEIGGERFELRHGRGETDDHLWLWAPGRGVLCTGDFFIWTLPNAGNPQKVQRYAGEWAATLREMATRKAKLLLPGHGLPIAGAERVAQALDDTATLLESLEEQTLALINSGARLDTVLREVRPPPGLLERPYLRPIYDEPEFVVRNIWRLYAGWWDGNPAHLKPATEAQLATELALLAGGAARLAERGQQLADSGNLRLAAHLVELARLAQPEDANVLARHHDVYNRLATSAGSTMARGIFTWAAEAGPGPAPP